MPARRGGTDCNCAVVYRERVADDGGGDGGGPAGYDFLEAGEEGVAGAGLEGGDGGAERVVAALEAGAVGRVGRAEPAAVAEDPVARSAAKARVGGGAK